MCENNDLIRVIREYLHDIGHTRIVIHNLTQQIAKITEQIERYNNNQEGYRLRLLKERLKRKKKSSKISAKVNLKTKEKKK